MVGVARRHVLRGDRALNAMESHGFSFPPHTGSTESIAMKRRMIHLSFAVMGMMFWAGWPAADARAGFVLVNQPYDSVSAGAPSQVFADYPSYSTKVFDDFTVPVGQTWTITNATIFGLEGGQPSQNQSVNLAITSAANFSAPNIGNGGNPYLGSETNQNLLFSLGGGLTLTAGTYWITAWVVRPELNSGGQWFWLETTHGHDSQWIFHNPGGGFGYGTNPIPGTDIPGSAPHLAFQLVGTTSFTAVPEPASWCLLTMGGLALSLAGRRIRKNPSRERERAY